MDTILSPDQYAVLWWSSWQPLFAGSYAAYRGHYGFAALCYLVTLTSLNYWRYPTLVTWRRTMDIACVQIALWYHIISAYSMANAVPYYITTGMGMVFFVAGVKAHTWGYPWPSTLCHVMVHVLGNGGNLFLYASDCSGTVKNIITP